jgi:hypothetical protein
MGAAGTFLALSYLEPNDLCVCEVLQASDVLEVVVVEVKLVGDAPDEEERV